MTKKHFVEGARMVREQGPCNTAGHDQCNRCAVETALVRLFHMFGPNFDEGRFREACAPRCQECNYLLPGHAVRCTKSERRAK